MGELKPLERIKLKEVFKKIISNAPKQLKDEFLQAQENYFNDKDTPSLKRRTSQVKRFSFSASPEAGNKRPSFSESPETQKKEATPLLDYLLTNKSLYESLSRNFQLAA